MLVVKSWLTKTGSLKGTEFLQQRELDWKFETEGILGFTANLSIFLKLVLLLIFLSCIPALGLPGGSDSNESSWNAEDPSLIPWRRKWQPTPVVLPGKSQGQRSLAGYSPWGCKESDIIWQLNHHHQYVFVNPKLLIYCSSSFPFSNRGFVSYVCDSVSLFQNKFICIIFLDSTYKWYHRMFVFLWLTSFSMIISGSIHVAENGIISFFSWLSSIPVCVCVCVHHIFFIHSSVNGHICFIDAILILFMTKWWSRTMINLATLVIMTFKSCL